MKIARREPPAVSGLVGTARVLRPGEPPRRLGPGDVAVLDQSDLDQETARSLLRAEVAAVLNARPMVSGRFPGVGPRLIAEAGVPVVDDLGGAGLGRLRDGAKVRIDAGHVYLGAGEDPVATGRAVEPATLLAEVDAARTGMQVRLESLTHNAAELLRREHDLLLGGTGLPALRTRMQDRPVVVLGPDADVAAVLRRLRHFLREQDPVVLAVDEAADAARRGGHQPHVLVLSAGSEPPAARTVRKAADVVVVGPRGGPEETEAAVRRLGVNPSGVETTVGPVDVALLLAARRRASLVAAAGALPDLAGVLDRRRHDAAGSVLARLQVGPRLVDADALPALYVARIRLWHLLLVLLAGLVALGAAVAVTPVGELWFADLTDLLRGLLP